MLSRQPGARLFARAASSWTRGAASVAEPVETAASAPVMPPCEFTPLPYDGPSREETLALRKRFLSPGTMYTSHAHSQVLAQAPDSPHPLDETQYPKWSDLQCTVTPLAALFHHFKEPVMLVEGKQQWLFDETGRRYLDVSCLPVQPRLVQPCISLCLQSAFAIA